jgi:hypothetical protein
MEPNTKLFMEEMLKQVREEIQVMQAKMKEGFVVHESFINNRVVEFFATEQQRDERVTMLKSATAELDKSFTTWKPEIESSITSVRLELSKLNSFFDWEAKATSNPSSGVLNIWSASTRSPTGFAADGPAGHHSNTTHWDCGFGSVYTQIHDPFKGTMPPLLQILLLLSLDLLFLETCIDLLPRLALPLDSLLANYLK